MLKLLTSTILLLTAIIRAYPDSLIDPCVGYWEQSYKHPYLENADSLYDVERFTEALILYQSAAEKFENQQNWEGLLKARNRLADCYRFSTTLKDSAYAILKGNQKIIEEHFNSDPNEMAEVHFITGLCYDWGNRSDKALEEYNKSLEIRIQLRGENHIDVVRGFYAIGDMYSAYEQNLNAKEYLTTAADLSATLDCHGAPIIAQTYYSLASVSRKLGDLEKAGIYGLKTISMYENDPFAKSRSYNLVANVNEAKNEFEQSISYNKMAINLLRDQQPLDISQKENLANYLHSLANVNMQLGKYDSAQLYYQQSLQIYENELPDRNEVLQVYQSIGINNYLLGQNDSADYYLSKAVTLRKQINGAKHLATSVSLQEKGNFYRYLGQLDSALYYYQQALVAAAGPDFNNFDANANPLRESFTGSDVSGLLNALYLKGSVFRKIYQRDQDPEALVLSLKTLLLAIELLDVNQELYQLEGSTLFMASERYVLFEEALSVCYSLHNLTGNMEYLETAFFIMEKSKARLLFDSFSDLQKSRIVGVPDSLIQKENDIRSRFASFSRDLESKKKEGSENAREIKELQDKVFDATVELEEFKQSLQASYPSYATAMEHEPQELSSILSKLSKGHQTMVNYFWGDSALYTLVLQDEQVSFYKQPVSDLNQLIKTYQQHLHQGPQFTDQAARFMKFHQTAHELFKVLFKGIDTGESALIIAADGPLRFIPFEALVLNEPGPDITDYHQLDYVVLHYPTGYVYSASMWALRPKEALTKPRALGFSHSDRNFADSKSTNELPGTAREMEILKSQLNGSFFSGAEATKENFIDHARDYDIIHLSIHGISDSVSRLNNRLLFRDQDDPELTHPLYTYELYNLQLNSRLAILSACESGTGRNYQGEGVYSLSRAFSYAGCPSTVMSLWRINDKITPEIMEVFYRQISKGERIDLGLQRAKLTYLENHRGSSAHPSHWAAMVVHGSSEPVVAKPRTVWLIPILIAFVVLTFVLISGRSKRK